MARRPEPRWRENRNGWFVKVKGRLIRLADRKEDKKLAYDKFHEIMAQKDNPQPNRKLTVSQLTNEYVKVRGQKVCSEHLRKVKGIMAKFGKAVHDKEVSRLTPSDLDDYVLDHEDWSNNTRKTVTDTVNTVLNFAVRKKFLTSNPCTGYEKYPTESRGKDVIVSQPEYESLVDCANSSMADLLTFLWETGCRPSEACKAEARHFDPKLRVLNLDEHKNRKKGHDRIIRLSQKAFGLVQKLSVKYPSGRLFRNTEGGAWVSHQASDSFRLVRKRCKIRASVTLYSFRHSFATSLLNSGVSAYLVADMMGTSIAMLEKHYGKQRLDNEVIFDWLDRVRP